MTVTIGRIVPGLYFWVPGLMKATEPAGMIAWVLE